MNDDGEPDVNRQDKTPKGRLHHFERWAMDELRLLEHQIINHHSAAYILVAVVLLGFVSAGSMIMEDAPNLKNERSETIYLSGVVTNSSGEPLHEATIAVKGTSFEATTNEMGYFYIGTVPTGTYEITASAQGHSVQVIKTTLRGEGVEMLQFLLKEGSGTEYVEQTHVPPPPSFFSLTSILVVFIIFTSFLSLIGAVYAYMGKRFKLTLVCSAAATMSYGFIAGSVLGLIALVFVMLSKNDFDDL